MKFIPLHIGIHLAEGLLEEPFVLRDRQQVQPSIDGDIYRYFLSPSALPEQADRVSSPIIMDRMIKLYFHADLRLTGVMFIMYIPLSLILLFSFIQSIRSDIRIVIFPINLVK